MKSLRFLSAPLEQVMFKLDAITYYMICSENSTPKTLWHSQPFDEETPHLKRSPLWIFFKKKRLRALSGYS